MNVDFRSECRRILEVWELREFDSLIQHYGMDLFQLALRLSIQDIAPNSLDSFTREKLNRRILHYYADVDTLLSLRLKHKLDS